MPQSIGLAFLGTSEYQTARYVWENESPVLTRYVQVAVQKTFDLDRFFVAMTDRAREVHEQALTDCMAKNGVSLERLDIDVGNSEAEWWDMFETIVEALPDEAALTIDITHGFRSQPLIALAIAVYLQAATDVTVERIVYGSFRGAYNKAPILDLTPFLDLIEWSVAARQFLRDGSAKQLARLLKNAQAEAHRTNADVKPKHASRTGSQLESLTDAFAVVRPQEIAESRAAGLVDTLEDLQDDVARLPGLQPVSLVLEQIQERIAPMQAPSLFDQQGFAAQMEMMRFFLQTKQFQQAVTLAREALVSHQALQMGLSPEPVPRSEWEGSGRDQAKNHLNRLAKHSDDDRLIKEKRLGVLWAQVIDVRNDINHAGMNPDPAPGRTLASNATTVVEDTIAYITERPV